MGHWNHRVMRHNAGTEDEYFAIHEVYYDLKDDDGKKETVWTKDPVRVSGETVEELRETLERMLRALDTPVMEYNDD